jgi:FMN phosphatase YigB (HAD superfamily)
MSANSVKALFFDVFGTLVDWRSGVARDAELVLKPLGLSLDWPALADAWREQYQPAMEEVRSGRLRYTKLDVLHRQTLRLILPRFGIDELAAADAFGLSPSECMMCAAHSSDLEAAADNGLRTAFIARPEERPGLSDRRPRMSVDVSCRTALELATQLGAY